MKKEADPGKSAISGKDIEMEHEIERTVDLEGQGENACDWRKKAYAFLTDHQAGWGSRLYHYYLDSMVVLSMFSLCLTTIPSLSDAPWEERMWYSLETFIAVQFIADFLVKMITCRPLSRYTFSWLFVADLLSIIPWITESIVLMVVGENSPSRLNVLRLLRMLRFARFYNATFTAFPEMHLFVQAVRQSRLAVIFLFVFISFSGIFFSSLLFYAETSVCQYDRLSKTWTRSPDQQPCAFQNIFEAGWFVMVTITTVGYGDVQVRTTMGKVVTVVMMIFSVIGLSLPVSIFGANLTQLYLERRLEKKAFKASNTNISKSDINYNANSTKNDTNNSLNLSSNSIINNDSLLLIISELQLIRHRLDLMERKGN